MSTTSFNTTWLTHPKYSGWLEAVKGRPSVAFCRPCHKEIYLGNMEKSSLDSHCKSKKHAQKNGSATTSTSMRNFMSDSSKATCSTSTFSSPKPSPNDSTCSTVQITYSEDGHKRKSLNATPGGDLENPGMCVPPPPAQDIDMDNEDEVNLDLRVPPPPPQQQAPEKKDILKGYDPKTERLDEFFHSILADNQESLQLWQIIQLTLIISHGQASIERSFSINDDILVPNMKAETLCAMKTVYDVIQSLNIKIHEFEVTDKMLQYCGQARSKYNLHLIDAKTNKKKEAVKRKGAEAQDAYVQAKKKLKTLEDEGNSCLKEADKKAQNSLKKHDFKLLAQSIALREKGKATLDKDVSDQRRLVLELQSKLVQ